MFGNSFDFAAMDKYTKTKCCLEKRPPDILTYGILKMAQYGQMLLGQMLPGQMSLWQLTSVEDGPRKLTLNFGQNRISNSGDIADLDKCHQDKYCMDELQYDCLNMF